MTSDEFIGPTLLLPRYLLGQRVFFADGRNGIVLDRGYNPVARQWQYAVEGLGAWFLERDLSLDSPPLPALPEAPLEVVGAGDFVTRADVDRILGDALSFVTGGPGVTEARLSEVLADAVHAADLQAQAHNQLLRDDIEGALTQVTEELAELGAVLTSALAEITERFTAFDQAVDVDAPDGGGGGFLGFVGGVAGFLRNPFGWLMERIEDQVLEEVRDGLNR